MVTATGRFILAVIRDVTEDRPQVDLAELAEMVRAAGAADDARRGRELLSQVVDGLFRVGLSLQAATELPHEAAVQQIADALQPWMTQSARSMTTCSPIAIRTARRIPCRQGGPDKAASSPGVGYGAWAAGGNPP